MRESIRSHILEIVSIVIGIAASAVSYYYDFLDMVNEYAPTLIFAMIAAFCVGIVFGLFVAGYSKEREKTMREQIRLEHERTLAAIKRKEKEESDRIRVEDKKRDHDGYLIRIVKELDFNAKEALAYVYWCDCCLPEKERNAPYILPIKRWLIYETVEPGLDRLLLTDDMREFLDDHTDLIDFIEVIE